MAARGGIVRRCVRVGAGRGISGSTAVRDDRGRPAVTPGIEFALGASAVAGGVAGMCVHHATYAVRSQWLGPTDWRGPVDVKSIALTFDDGPADDTARILDYLAALEVRAAFFMLGRQVERHPRIARRIVEDGHEVGNHSYSHPIFLVLLVGRNASRARANAGDHRRDDRRAATVVAAALRRPHPSVFQSLARPRPPNRSMDRGRL